MNLEDIKIKWTMLPYTLLADISDEEVLPPKIEKMIPFVVHHSQRLLSIGGYRVCMSYSDIVNEDITMKAGEVINHSGIIFKRGEQHQCHRTSAKRWLRSKNSNKLVTGYALSDRLWLRHSWLLNQDNKIVESTFSAAVYFGVILEKEKAEDFCRYILE